MDLEAGTLIGERYRLERVLGKGGMGVVWAAEDISTHQRHALKLMKEAPEDADARRRFVREARAAAAVRHPNVVTIVDVLELDDGSPVIVMELLDGESLRALLARVGKLAMRELAEIALPVISAVGTAHALGIVHRDLKPENIFLSRGPSGERIVKVLDFGIAKLTALDGEAMQSTGLSTSVVLGTPAYMAPEQVFGETDLDHRADIWALGIVIYQCLSGVLPTEGDNVGQVLKNVLAKPFEPLVQHVLDVPPQLARLVARMLSRDRSARPADLREVLQLFEELAQVLGIAFDAPAHRRTGSGAAADTIELRPSAHVGRVDALATTGEIAPRWPPERPRMMRRAAVIIALLGAGIAAWRWTQPTHTGQPPLAARSLLDVPGAKLACPILEASGVPAPAVWLGAAAAATVCERARVILGGRPERTLVPAELLDVPPRLVDDFPDRYAERDARERSLIAARQRADLYVDGEVMKGVAGFAVVLRLHAPNSMPIAIAGGSGRGLYEAVRTAMTALVGPGLLPMANRLDPEIAPWSRTQDVPAALALLDLTLAFAHNAGGLKEECQRFEQVSSRIGELGPVARWRCGYTMGLPAPPVALGPPDSSMEGIATRIRIRHYIERVDDPEDAKRLHEFSRTTSAWGRALLAATESCLVQASAPKRARELAITAVAAAPKNPDGNPCEPWDQLMTLTQGIDSAENATRAMQAWQPWNGTGWFMHGLAAADPAVALQSLRRAYELTPFDAQTADALAGQLLAANKPEQARNVALELSASGYPVDQIASEMILVRVDASTAQFRAALERATNASKVSSDDFGWVRAQRFDAAWRALELASLLGDTHPLADELVLRFIVPDPPPLDGSALPTASKVAAICAQASPSIARQCFARFRSLRGQLSGGLTPHTEEFVRGAESYASGDLVAAARSWRPAFRGDRALALLLPDAMATAFERSNNPELVEQVDVVVTTRANEFNGATRAHVRAAWRAFRRGDAAAARTLARKVIDAWGVADDDVPAVDDMRRLSARLPQR